MCVWDGNTKPAKQSKIWPVFDSGGFADTAVLNVRVSKRPITIQNPLLYQTSRGNTELDELFRQPVSTDLFGGLNAAWKQIQLSNKIPNDDVTKKIFSSVSRQLRIINTHFQQCMFRYKYPRVTRSNVLLEYTPTRRPATHFSLTLKVIRFQATPRRELPCYGNLELPLKIKHEGALSQVYAGIRNVQGAIKMESDRVKTEKDRERDREREKERER